MGEQLTEDDIRKIKKEISDRKGPIRAKILEELKAAKAQGDLSENFEYYSAKRANGRNNSRIRYLERLIKYGKVVEEAEDDGRAGINSKVTCLFMDRDKEASYRIVTTVRQNPLIGLISVQSPVARALMGHREGDIVHVDLGDGRGYDLKILSIEKEDDSQDEINPY